MKKWLIIGLLMSFCFSQSLKIDKLRTELYSKEGKNSLKKIELSLELEGDDLLKNEAKILDSTNIVVSGFFYEDLFTELGKLRFKDTLTRFINKKYKLKISSIYILSLRGIEKFDIEELKSFLQDDGNINKETKLTKLEEKKEENKEQNLSINIPKIPPLPNINSLLNEEDKTVDDLDLNILQNLPTNIPPQPIQLKDANLTSPEF
ncbi:flagellar basal body-associated FliL family protein [Campylobacter troglodytis]|uniref:flagellar basal body-associated FliL family protein n=1 Tax=Campylobacter troglodytis TaxID=654363 RepID=UPI0011577DDB|nr:flagellar basal body-associated FliL family protein [Campylobacter troglodytis]TQR61605.1 hypothetical protein DMC01_00075 [Campylobacter troglodytis]